MDNKYKVKLIERTEVAKETMLFKWEKPKGFTFRAGQTLDWTQIDPSEIDKEGNMRTFSIVAAPYEDWIGFATRMRDTAFKRNLSKFAVGEEIEAEGPYGSFTLHNNPDKVAIYLTGGIGITPARSIVKQAMHEKLPHKIFLFYSNHSTEDTAFLDEFDDLAKQNSNFKFIPTMTQDESWTGQKGRISFELITKHCSSLENAIFYISGPASMVNALKQTLIEAKVDEDNIRAEDFPGY